MDRCKFVFLIITSSAFADGTSKQITHRSCSDLIQFLVLGDTVIEEERLEGFVQAHFAVWAKSLNLDEREGLQAMGANYYSFINGLLRSSGSSHDTKQFVGRLLRDAKADEQGVINAIEIATKWRRGIDQAIKKLQTPQKLTVFRSDKNLEWTEGWDSFSEGQVIAEKGYVSTSLSRQFVNRWSTHMHNRSGVQMTIEVPSGTHIAYLGAGDLFNDGRKSFEVLLPSNSKLKILKKFIDGSGQKHLHLELMP